MVDNNPQLGIEVERKKNFISNFNPKENFKVFIASIFILIAIIGVGSLAGRSGNNQQQEGGKTSSLPPSSNNTIVYGYWTDKGSQIGAMDLSSGEFYNLATLDLKVKKATVLSSDSVAFINKTDDSDHGREIASYNFLTKTTATLFSANDGFGIDDYVISPNKRFIASWEIQKPSGQTNLLGGRSRVYTIDLQNLAQKNLIYDENISENIPIHYPISISDSGEVLLDGFIANATAGWANGMTYSDISGLQKQDIPSMRNGTYSTQPVSSADGKYLAFAGYDGSLGAGTQLDESGFRIAYVNPNTIEILNTVTKERKKLAGLPNTDRYAVYWDKDSSNIIFTITSKDINKNGYYLYDLTSESYKKIEIGQDEMVVSSLSDTLYLTGKTGQSSSSIGNLGPKYSSGYGTLSVFDSVSKKTTSLNIGIPFMQYVGNLPSGYFDSSSSLLGVAVEEETQKNNLQLQTFAFKPSLAPVRQEQQSKPAQESKNKAPCSLPGPECPTTCNDLAHQQCRALLGPLNVNNNIAWHACYRKTFAALMHSGTCYDSPLYLYGKEGTKVDIKVGTKITKPIPYSTGDYSVVLKEKGEFMIGKNKYSSINFNYAPAIDMPVMTYGRVVKAEKVNSTLEEYGKKLGLNSQEISDLRNSVRFSSPYVWVSFYSDEISKNILPISFSPEPDVYRNIVFYFKTLDAPMSVPEPKFDPVHERKGFTAVEVSHTIE